jgi:glutaminyl-peptide cyclotransferase
MTLMASSNSPMNGGRAMAVLAIIVAGLALRAQSPVAGPPAGSKVPQYGFTVMKAYPHDPTAFTQGLEFKDGVLYEGTGLKGHSAVRRVELETGKVLQQVTLHPDYFGEGITLTGGKVFELTWQTHFGFVYDARTLRLVRQFSYFGEGWGLTHDSVGLIMSDGTSSLRFFEPTRFHEVRKLKVMDGASAIGNLNELEWVKGEIWANVWQSDYIARISPKTGQVLGWINLKGLSGPAAPAKADAVLNGIAYDSAGDRLFVTGKLWPKVFEITLKPAAK